VGVAGGEEFFLGFVHGLREDGEEDAAGVAGDEIKAALLLDELEGRRHGRRAVKPAIRSIHRSGEEINGDLHAIERNFDLYQIGTDSAQREFY